MRVIDSHTEGEPTRLVVSGGPELRRGPLAERRNIFAERHDRFRTFALNEPRGFDAMVGALLCEPVDPTCASGLIFFNNVGYLGMCGHGTIGAAVSLAHMGRIAPGLHRFETPVGDVTVELHDRNTATIANVPSYLHRRDVTVEVEGFGAVSGDVAWGGNWFFLTDAIPCAIEAANVPILTEAAQAIRRSLVRGGVTGRDGGEIDHVELFGPSPTGANALYRPLPARRERRNSAEHHRPRLGDGAGDAPRRSLRSLSEWHRRRPCRGLIPGPRSSLAAVSWA
jgi:4-hydroxyproline epimerase